MKEKHRKLREWEENELKKSLERFPERKERFSFHGGEEVPRLSLPDRIDEEYLENIGFPGQYPFTRGVQPTMYRGRLWTMRQYAGFSTAADSNRRFRFLLDQGTTGLSVAFDLPTQIGYDSDDTKSLGEVGKVGVAIDSLADMEALFDTAQADCDAGENPGDVRNALREGITALRAEYRERAQGTSYREAYQVAQETLRTATQDAWETFRATVQDAKDSLREAFGATTDADEEDTESADDNADTAEEEETE